MGGQQSNTDWTTTLWAVTRDQYVNGGKVQDNFFNKMAALDAINKNSQVIIRDGGVNLLTDLLVSDNTGTNSYTGYDPLDTTPQKGIINGTLGKAYYATPITISTQEEKENSGEEKMADLLASKMMQAEFSQRKRITTDLFLDGTGNAGKNLTGLLAMIPTASAVTGTYMGVSTSTTWIHKIVDVASGGLLTALDQLYYKVSDGGDVPDIVIMNASSIAQYEALNKNGSGMGVVYVNASKADSGFTAAQYKGKQIVYDVAAPAGIIHMLNSAYLGFYYTVETSDFVRPANQLARVAILNSCVQLLTNNRRRQGKVQWGAI